jgi:hypothetical protein
MTYRLHYISADRQGDDSPWSVYVEEYAFPDDPEPLDGMTEHVSTHATEAEAEAEAARLQELERRAENVAHHWPSD